MVVTWALGHLIEFIQPDEYGKEFERWDMSHLPIIPAIFKTKPIERSKAQYDIVKHQLQRSDIDEVICATDAGREGELIFRLVYEDAGVICQSSVFGYRLKPIWPLNQALIR